MAQREDIAWLYKLPNELEQTVGGKQKLKDCTGCMDWPDRGVYFSLTSDGHRDAGDQLRTTRIETHTVSERSSTSFWDRLRTHREAKRGTCEGDESHRDFVFWRRVDEAFVECDSLNDECPHWGRGSSAKREQRLDKFKMERRIGDYPQDLSFLRSNIDDGPKAESQRTYIERNMIVFPSSYQREAIGARSDNWLRNRGRSKEIRESGLRDVDHVGEDYDPEFLGLLHDRIEETSPV